MIYNNTIEYTEEDKIKKLFKLVKLENGNTMIFFNEKLILDFKNVSNLYKTEIWSLKENDMNEFIKVITKKYKTIHNFLSLCIGLNEDPGTIMRREILEFIKENLRTTTTLYDYNKEFLQDKEKGKWHGYYSAEFSFRQEDSIIGNIKLDYCNIDLGLSDNIRIYDTPGKFNEGTNDIYFKIEDEIALKKVIVKYYDMGEI